MNSAAITGLASKNYYTMLYKKGEDKDKDKDKVKVNPAEPACIGLGLAGRFENTLELHVMNYKAVIKMSDKPKRDQAINEEHEQMTKMEVWEAAPRSKLPKDAKVICTTWAN